MRLRIIASPQGRRSGLALGGEGVNAVSIAVLPKLWRPEPAGGEWRHTGPWPLQLVLHELETVEVECTNDQQEQALLELAAWTTRKRTRGSSAGDDADGSDEEDGDEDCLLGVQPVRDREAFPQDVDPYKGRPVPAEAVTQLLSLSLLAHKCATAHRPLAAVQDGAPGMLVASTRNSTPANALLLFLQEWQFVEEITRRQRDIRRGYVGVTETLGAIRGRITARGLSQQAATGLPVLECAHDEFTDATPLFRVLVTALEVVGTGRSVAGLGTLGASLNRTVSRDALTLRRELAAIPSLPVSVASHLASTLRLSRLQATWQAALDFARSILTQTPPKLAPPQDGGCAAWWIETDKLWEGILEKSLRSAGLVVEAQRERGVTPYQPWLGLGKSKRPDLRVALDTGQDKRSWVLDAKYKPPSKLPNSSDQYQVFAYSIMVDGATEKVSDAGLVTPLVSNSCGISEARRRPVDKPANAGSPLAVYAGARIHGPAEGAAEPPCLHLIDVSFPPADLLPADVDAWLTRTGAAFKDCLVRRPRRVGTDFFGEEPGPSLVAASAVADALDTFRGDELSSSAGAVPR